MATKPSSTDAHWPPCRCCGNSSRCTMRMSTLRVRMNLYPYCISPARLTGPSSWGSSFPSREST